MANDQQIIITGKLTEDPQLRFTPSGAAVANFTIAFNPRRFDRNTNEWVNGEATFWRCEAWNQGKLARAENICNMLKKGDSVIAQGVVETKKWQDKEGQNRSALQVTIQSMGKDLTFHGQAYQQNDAQAFGQSAGGNPNNGWGSNQPAAQDDPWATPAASNNQGGGWGAPPQDPPF
ncbi:ssDNA binding protein [Arthrobacter phage Persistence]|uniref:Single-stranded DNA-binding protein n=1 Tax=Arthrobacter phage Persistence TaxID=2836007 RepID=A0A8F3E7V3_9CAUD|nr:ssDNA binding protein [Arthrobacter phage Persistence]QWY79693.1 ssDNA binding protein [Arthrobacter phage Persistence]